MTRAIGPFDVSLKPLPMDDPGSEMLGRMSLEKVFRGDLEGTGKGQMLTGGTPIRNSAAYVAIERVSGALNGRRGTFVLQHSGTMTRGAHSRSIRSLSTRVPERRTSRRIS